MLRAVLTILIGVWIWTISPAAAETKDCLAGQPLQDFLKDRYPGQFGAVSTTYDATDSDAIRNGIMRMQPVIISSDVRFVAYGTADADALLIVGLDKDGCYSGSGIISIRFIKAWLAGSAG